MEQVKENRMGTAPIPGLIIRMSLPMMVSMLVMALYNVVDSIYVSQLSENALTAVSLVFPYQMVITSVAVGTGIGTSSLISRRLGAKLQAEADSAAENGLFLAILSGAFFAAVFSLFSRPLIMLFQPESEILQYSLTYLSIVGTFSIFSVFQIISEKIIQATGNMVYPMLIQLIGAVINIIFDPILIFGQYGFPALGVAGAAIATVGGQFIGMLLGIFLLFFKTKLVTVRLRKFRPSGATIRQIYAVGIPSIVMQAIASVGNIVLNKVLIGFTPTAVSVLGVYYKLQSFVFMPVFGLNSGTMPVIGYNFGAKNKRRVMTALKCGVLYAFVIMCIGFAVFQLFPDKLLGLFNASENMLDIGMRAFRTISICFPFAAVSIMFSTLFQAIGDGVHSLVVSVCRQLVAIIPSAIVLSALFGLDAVWYCFLVAEFFGLAVSIFLMNKSYRLKIVPLEAADK